MCCCFCDCILVLLAVLFPPLPVWCKRGLCSVDSLINILLCCLGYFPGLLHSWYIISRYPEDEYIIFDEELQVYVYPRLTEEHHHHHHHYVATPPPSTSLLSAPLESNSGLIEGHSTDNNVRYGATGDQNDDEVPPPAYDNVMNETLKSSK